VQALARGLHWLKEFPLVAQPQERCGDVQRQHLCEPGNKAPEPWLAGGYPCNMDVLAAAIEIRLAEQTLQRAGLNLK